MTASATGFISLLVFRVLFGAGEGPLVPATNKVVNNWFPHREVATAVGIAFCGTPFGGAIAGPIIGLLSIRFGWRISFLAIAALGGLWLLLWLLLAAETPSKDSGISVGELRDIEANRPKITEPEDQSLTEYFRRPTVVATAVAYFAYNYILFFFLSWFPSYLVAVHRLSLQDTGFASALPWFMGFVGLALSGVFSDFILRRTARPLFARKVVLTLCLSLSGLSVASAGLVSTASGRVALMTTSILFLYLSGTSYFAILSGHDPRSCDWRCSRVRASDRELRWHPWAGDHRIPCRRDRHIQRSLPFRWHSRDCRGGRSVDFCAQRTGSGTCGRCAVKNYADALTYPRKTSASGDMLRLCNVWMVRMMKGRGTQKFISQS
jgi:MFS family permease